MEAETRKGLEHQRRVLFRLGSTFNVPRDMWDRLCRYSAQITEVLDADIDEGEAHALLTDVRSRAYYARRALLASVKPL